MNIGLNEKCNSISTTTEHYDSPTDLNCRWFSSSVKTAVSRQIAREPGQWENVEHPGTRNVSSWTLPLSTEQDTQATYLSRKSSQIEIVLDVVLVDFNEELVVSFQVAEPARNPF